MGAQLSVVSACRGAAGSGVSVCLPNPGSARSAPGRAGVPGCPRWLPPPEDRAVPGAPRFPGGAAEAPGPRGWGGVGACAGCLAWGFCLASSIYLWLLLLLLLLLSLLGGRPVIVEGSERLWCFPPSE